MGIVTAFTGLYNRYFPGAAERLIGLVQTPNAKAEPHSSKTAFTGVDPNHGIARLARQPGAREFPSASLWGKPREIFDRFVFRAGIDGLIDRLLNQDPATRRQSYDTLVRLNRLPDAMTRLADLSDRETATGHQAWRAREEIERWLR